MSKEGIPVLFIDRDGVINHMILSKSKCYDSPQKPEDVSLIEGITDVISWMNRHKIPVVEITNRPEYAKGKMSMETLESIEKKVHELLERSGVKIDHVYKCLHHPRGIVPEFTLECDCRKPKPGLFIQAAKELDINLSRSVLLGDNASDVEAGKNAGCKTIIYLHQEDTPEKIEKAKKADVDYKVDKISDIIPILKGLFLKFR